MANTRQVGRWQTGWQAWALRFTIMEFYGIINKVEKNLNDSLESIPLPSVAKSTRDIFGWPTLGRQAGWQVAGRGAKIYSYGILRIVFKYQSLITRHCPTFMTNT